MENNHHLFLIGFMGAGKSTVGSLLAKKLSVDFIDLDQVVEDAEEKTIPELFSTKGERYFREKEAEYLKMIKGNKVIATGGGILYFDDTLAWMKENGTVVYLEAPFSILYQRIAEDSNRPVATQNSKEQLERIFTERHKNYQRAAVDMTVPSYGEIEETISAILKKIGKLT
ncbi:shikimate kinase [Jeotgalibacillus campisalis]|uniref:Shikimate kinase n=1 Tax=Jeotgalibacillus campisalis TaxID=220754 RepID=A0A0C2RW50_9BACL|nr:shikimate kinase [Jeotgalibacillus campisalis]KIL45974.1 shikimate kinase [Jeotgalibacillus campisalis]